MKKNQPSMAEQKINELMEKIVSLCKRKGFVFQSSEIYGGINGFWDYGPLGAEIKRNVKYLWWTAMTRFRDDVVGLEATIIMSPKIWEASGHVATFADLMRECPMTRKRVRADQVEEQSGTAYSYSGAKDLSVSPESGKLVIEHLKTSGEFPDAVPAENVSDTITGSAEAFSYLLPAGKPPEAARKAAIEFYLQRGVKTPELLNESVEKVENSMDYHPESRVKLSAARPFNLMFKTYVGPVESADNVAYLRPETAQAIFAQFKNVLETSRQMPPFGIAQIGKAFRNEVTPRNFTFRSREFEQMELEFFIKPDEVIEAISGRVATLGEIAPPAELPVPQADWGWQAWHAYWVEERVRFYEGIGLTRDTLAFHRQTPAELAHYARACVDILYKFPFSKRNEKGELLGDELEGIAARGDFDLSQHERFSGKPMRVFDEELRVAWAKLDDAKKTELSQRYFEHRKNYMLKSDVAADKAEKLAKEDAEGLAKGQYVPHVIEPSAGVDRLILALISNAYCEEQVTDEKGKAETRIVMKFHPRIAPVKVGVFPLLKNKPELVKKAREIQNLLRPHMIVFYDEAGAIGRRYRRQDEAGTPFCVTIDFDTLGEKPELLDTVTLRERDTMQQTRVKIADLVGLLCEKIR
jgi:glycyl-tRNA synthetase